MERSKAGTKKGHGLTIARAYRLLGAQIRIGRKSGSVLPNVHPSARSGSLCWATLG